MDSVSRAIYDLVRFSGHALSNKEIARHLRMKNDRQLQGSGEEKGILERAREEIYNTYDLFLVTNFSGSILTHDPDLAEAYTEEVWKRSKRSFDNLRALRERIEHTRARRIEKQQLELSLNV